MDHHAVGVGDELAERHTRSQPLDVEQHLRLGQLVQPPLPVCGLAPRADEAARDVGHVAVRSHHVGVEADYVAGADEAVAALLEPWVGALVRREQAALDPLAAVGDVGLVQHAPELVLGDAGLNHGADAPDREVADRHRRPQAVQLLLRLDHARLLDRRLHADQADAARKEALGGLRVAAIDSEAAIATAVVQDQARDLLGPRQRLLTSARASEEVGEGRAGALLVEGLDLSADMSAARELEQDHRALGGHEGVAAAVVHGPQGHVAGAGGVVQVDQIGEQGARDVQPRQFGAQTLQPSGPELGLVDRPDSL